jgi:hypothetical protein
MSVKKGSNVTYMYTGDFLPEGEYCIQVRGLLNKEYIHTIIAGVVPYTGHTNDIILQNFSNYENIIAISVTEESPQFSKPSDSFFKILNHSCLSCAKLPEHY